MFYSTLRVFLAGQARKRFGGNIPLIGICTWGTIQQRTLLEVSKTGLKLGYLTSPPVLYEKKQYGADAKNYALDPNHSHFIMVTRAPRPSISSGPIARSETPDLGVASDL